MAKNKTNTWEMSYDEFCKSTKTIRIPDYYEDYFKLGKTHLRCYNYYIYIDENLNVINPYTKKDENKKYIHRVCSTSSREDCITQAFLFIIQSAFKNDLLSESFVSKNKIKEQQEWLIQQSI